MEVEENKKQQKYKLEKLKLKFEMKENEGEKRHKLDIEWIKIEAKKQKLGVQTEKAV